MSLTNDKIDIASVCKEHAKLTDDGQSYGVHWDKFNEEEFRTAKALMTFNILKHINQSTIIAVEKATPQMMNLVDDLEHFVVTALNEKSKDFTKDVQGIAYFDCLVLLAARMLMTYTDNIMMRKKAEMHEVMDMFMKGFVKDNSDDGEAKEEDVA